VNFLLFQGEYEVSFLLPWASEFCPRFLANIGGYWALFEAKSWEEVGRWLPTSNIYKLGLLEAMGRSWEVQNRFMLPDC
jgi:hypothetical protein